MLPSTPILLYNPLWHKLHVNEKRTIFWESEKWLRVEKKLYMYPIYFVEDINFFLLQIDHKFLDDRNEIFLLV